MINNTFIFIVALFMVIRGATLATKYSAKLAESFRLSKYAVGFIVVAIISILPETFISINAAIEGVPSLGLAMLFGSNIADLTLIFAILILVAGRGLKIESKIIKNHGVYPFILLLPLVLGFDGYYSRVEGAALIIVGCIFYYIALKNGTGGALTASSKEGRLRNSVMLLLSMAVLLAGSYFVIDSVTVVASLLDMNPMLIAMLVVGLGTTMPELFFSLRSVKRREDSLAVGDILGTVLADATIVIGILALVSPFSFPQKTIFITGGFMVVASFLLFYFMRSGRVLSKKEGIALFVFWVVFVLTEFMVN